MTKRIALIAALLIAGCSDDPTNADASSSADAGTDASSSADASSNADASSSADAGTDASSGPVVDTITATGVDGKWCPAIEWHDASSSGWILVALCYSPTIGDVRFHADSLGDAALLVNANGCACTYLDQSAAIDAAGKEKP